MGLTRHRLWSIVASHSNSNHLLTLAGVLVGIEHLYRNQDFTSLQATLCLATLVPQYKLLRA